MENLSYEEATERLNKIIKSLEEGDLPMEKASAFLEEGEELIKFCYSSLDKAKGKLTEVKEVLGKLEEE